MQTNAAHNEVIAFAHGTDEVLTRGGSFATGGARDDNPHLTSQGSVTLTRDRRHLLVTNVGSNDVSVFAIDGAMPSLTRTIPAGAAPRSVTEHDGLVFVLATGNARINGFRLVDGDLVSIEAASMALSTPDGRALIVTERGGDRLSSYAVGTGGSLGARRTIESQGATPTGSQSRQTGRSS